MQGCSVTKHALLTEATVLDAQALNADGSWAEYLHIKAEHLRALAVETPEEE